MKRFALFVVLLCVAGSIPLGIALRPATAASPPRFWESSRLRIWNADTIAGTYKLSFRAGSDPAGPVLNSWTWDLAPGAKAELDLATDTVIPNRTLGNGTIDSNAAIGWEFFVPARTANVTLHNLEDVATTISLRYLDSAKNVLRSYTLPLGAEATVAVKETSFPPGSAYDSVEFASPQAFERYQSAYLPALRR